MADQAPRSALRYGITHARPKTYSQEITPTTPLDFHRSIKGAAAEPDAFGA